MRKTSRHMSEWEKELRRDARWYALLACIMAFGLFLSYLLYVGPQPGGDDATYIWLSQQPLFGPPFILGNIFAYGFLKLLPLKASFGILGYGSLQAILPNIIEYLVLIFMTFLIGSRFRDAKTGVVAAFLAATAPFAIANVTTVLPDIGTGMMLSISLYIFVRSLNSRHNALLPFLFGLSAVLVLYMNQQGFATLMLSWLYVIFLLAADMLFGRKATKRRATAEGLSFRYVLFALLGTAIGLSAYFLVFYLGLGRPFYIFAYDTFGPASVGPFAEIGTLLFSNFLAGARFNGVMYPLGPVFILAITGTAMLLARGGKRDNFLSFLTWGFLIVIVFGTTSISGQYTPFPVSTRFFNIVLAPMAVLGAYALTSTYNFLKRRWRPNSPASNNTEPAMLLLIALLFIVILSSVPLYAMLRANNLQLHRNAQTLYSIAELIQKRVPSGGATIYTHTYSGFNFVMPLFLQFAMGFNSSMRFYSINTSFIQTSPSCDLSHDKRPSFLVVANNYAPAVDVQMRSEAESWLGSNCIAVQLAQINQVYVYSLESST